MTSQEYKIDTNINSNKLDINKDKRSKFVKQLFLSNPQFAPRPQKEIIEVLKEKYSKEEEAKRNSADYKKLIE